MSYSKPNKSANPANKFISFKGSSGKLQYYDKERSENIDLDYPFKFIVLDELSTIKGFHDESQSAIYSNEVHNIVKDELIVKAFKRATPLCSGVYSEIKGNINSCGGRYTKSIYALDVQTKELMNINFQGAALSSWIEYSNTNMVATEGIITVTGTEDKKKGQVEYKCPLFERENVTKELNDAAMEADKLLQLYLEKYKQKKDGEDKEVETVEKSESEVIEAVRKTEMSDLPF